MIKMFTVFLVFLDVHELLATYDVPAMVFTQCSTGVWPKNDT